MFRTTRTQRRTWKERALSLLLTAALVAGLLPGLTLPASAEHWADSYLDQLVDWGVIRADQTANPDADLTRAEFMAIINRAYGYTEMGPIPFEDVLKSDWFYDDVVIAYTAGYMAGTSETTASPYDTLTREQAFCILGRNMMMKDTPGENLAFADSRDVSDWARGTIKAAAENYIISGYPDNTLHPLDSITKAQMAVLITQSLGTPIQQSGTYDLGGVFGNVTITAPNVTLRNAVISGDLYISGGVGLGGIKLENVDVLGRIIVSGTGESEGGEASVIMRNVTAAEMLVDNMRNKTVTIRADGITDIAKTVVRTNAYLEDNNTDDKGLMHIELDGEPGTRLTLAGRIKEVVNKTPSSFIQAAKGTVAKLTVDEAATNSTVQIDRNTKIAEVNLDVATSVLGDGDIGHLNINAPGSIVTMLPDSIYIRPGLTASIAGVIMDYQAAEEGSLDPRLLSGYPAAKDIAPTGFRADFAGNKKGTIYWAVSYVSDGSIGENDLISPPSYGSKAVTNGSVAAPAGGDEVSVQVGNLIVGGSYYLSAILVDEQNNRSPVKVISFSTPDNTVPAFAEGYPYMSRITTSVAQVTVMPTKSCKLYYALLPQGAKAPTVNELKAAAVTGNLGYGVRDVTKNTEDVFTVNSQQLEELKTYVLYLWLTDVDGANSSAITSLAFTIPDETPPVVDPIPYSVAQGTTGNTIAMRTGLSEQGTVYWAVVPHNEPYPRPNLQSEPLSKDNVMNEDDEAVSARLSSDYAKLGVQSGNGALISGSVAVNDPNAEVPFNVTGLLPETAYDLYYVGRDTAGNFSEVVKMVVINTLDTTGPIVHLYFMRPDESIIDLEADPQISPPANSSIILDFSEPITVAGNTDLLTINGTTQLAKKLQENFVLTVVGSDDETKPVDVTDLGTGKAAAIEEANASHLSWVDYSAVIVRESSTQQGHIEVVFPYGKAISMVSGRTYSFSLRRVQDTSGNYPLGASGTVFLTPDVAEKNPPHFMPEFTTAFATVTLRDSVTSEVPQPVAAKGSTPEANKKGGTRTVDGVANPVQLARMDTFFAVIPGSTKGMVDQYCYDIFLFAKEQPVNYDLYYRIIDTDPGSANRNKPLDPNSAEFKANKLPGDNVPDANETNGWIFLGNYKSEWNPNADVASSGVNHDMPNNSSFPKLNTLGEGLRYEFSLAVTNKDGSETYEAWNGIISFEVYVIGGTSQMLSGGTTGKYSAESLTSYPWNLQSIGVAGSSDHVTIFAPFSDSITPIFQKLSPVFKEGDTFETLKYALSPTQSHIYYRIAKRSTPLPTRIKVLTDVDFTTDADGNVVLAASDTPAGNITTIGPGGKTDTIDSSSPYFYHIIKLQTDEQPNPGQLYAYEDGVATGKEFELTNAVENNITGKLKYYEVIEDPGYVSRTAITNDRSYPTNYPGYDVYDWELGQKDLILPEEGALDPETEYYIYIVLESASGNPESHSQVYVYTFTTVETVKPRITLSGGSGGTVSVSTRWGTDNSVEADLEWVMFSNTYAKQKLESIPITIPQKDAKGKDIVGYVKTAPSDPDAASSVVVIKNAYDALTNTYYASQAYGTKDDPTDVEFGGKYSGYTVFDVFASAQQKAEVQAIIDTQGESVSLTLINSSQRQTTVETRATNYSKLVNWVENANTDTPQTGEYLFLIAGHNIGSKVTSSNWAPVNSFCAIDHVKYEDDEAPRLEDPPSTSATIKMTFDKEKDPDYNNPTMSGEIMLSFDKDVYWKSGSGKYYRVVEGKAGPDPDNEDAYTNTTVGIEYGILSTGIAAGDNNFSSKGKGGQSFTFTFDGVTGTRATILLFRQGGNIAANNGNTAGALTITIERSRKLQDPDTSEWYYEVTTTINYQYNTYATPKEIYEYTFTDPIYTGKTGASSDEEAKGASAANAPALASISASNVTGTATGSYSMNLALNFDQALYTKTGNKVTAVSGSKLATTSTVAYTPVKAGSSKGTISSSGSGKTYTLTLKNVKPGTLTLPSQTFYDETGKASATGKITVEIKEVKSSANSSKLPITSPQVTVSFDGVTQTKTLK